MNNKIKNKKNKRKQSSINESNTLNKSLSLSPGFTNKKLELYKAEMNCNFRIKKHVLYKTKF